jgi:hypothetical protein
LFNLNFRLIQIFVQFKFSSKKIWIEQKFELSKEIGIIDNRAILPNLTRGNNSILSSPM